MAAETNWSDQPPVTRNAKRSIMVPHMAKSFPFDEWFNDKETPLYVALLWIVSNGGQMDPYEMVEQSDPHGRIDYWMIGGPPENDVAYALRPEKIEAWRKATDELIRAVRDGVLSVSGLKQGKIEAKQLRVGLFGRSRAISPVAGDAEIFQSIMNPDLSLEFWAYESDDHDSWRECRGDILRKNDKIVWSRLAAPVAEIVKLWPSADPVFEYKTGAPGRPSAIQFVEQEAKRRRESGEANTTLRTEAAALHDWCRTNHEKIAAPSASTIENRIRADHNAWKSIKNPT